MRLFGAGEALRDEFATMPPALTMMIGDPVGSARAAIGDQAVEEAVAEGRAMDPDKAVAYALEESG